MGTWPYILSILSVMSSSHCYKMSDQVLKRTTLYALKIKKNIRLQCQYLSHIKIQIAFRLVFPLIRPYFPSLVYFFVNTCKSCVRQVNITVWYCAPTQHTQYTTKSMWYRIFRYPDCRRECCYRYERKICGLR